MGWLDLCVLDLERAAPEEYLSGRLSAGINAARAACSRELVFPWCGERPVLLTGCQAGKFKDKRSRWGKTCRASYILGC